MPASTFSALSTRSHNSDKDICTGKCVTASQGCGTDFFLVVLWLIDVSKQKKKRKKERKDGGERIQGIKRAREMVVKVAKETKEEHTCMHMP